VQARNQNRIKFPLDPFSDEQWGYVIETMSQRAIFAAKLLAEMPQNIEEVFTANGLSLFPLLADIRSKCSCPDKANLQAYRRYYQLGDRFSEDPFVLFQLRGRTDKSSPPTPTGLLALKLTLKHPTFKKDTQHPISSKIDSFWQYNEPLESALVVIAPPPTVKQF